MGVHERGREEKKKKELEKFKKRQARKKQQNWQNGKYSPGKKEKRLNKDVEFIFYQAQRRY